MQFPAKVTPQLNDGKWGGYDCWVATTRGLIAFASGGAVHLDYKTVRQRAGKYVEHSTPAQREQLGPGNAVDIKAVLKHDQTVADFKAKGLRPPKMRYLGSVKAATVFKYLVQGYQAAVAIDYGTLRGLRPNMTGDPKFNGNHSVRWYGAFDKDNKPKADLTAPFLSDQLDPLNDGRRPGIAKGPQRINRKTLIAEAEAVKFHDANGNVTGGVGQGNVLALVVKPAQRLDGAAVVPPPDLQSQLDDAEDQIAELENQQRAITDALDDPEPVDVIRQILTGVSDPNADDVAAGTSTVNVPAGDPPADDDDNAADGATENPDDPD